MVGGHVVGRVAASWSVTCAATIVTVHSSLFAKSTAGSRVKVVGPPLSVVAWPPLVAQLSVNHAPVTVTGSLKVTLTLLLTGTSVAPFVGLVLARLAHCRRSTGRSGQNWRH